MNTSAMGEGESTELRYSSPTEPFGLVFAGDVPIADVSCNHLSADEQRKWGKRIVHCCNAHDALVDVIETIVRQCGERLTDASGNTALLDHAKYVLSKYGSAS